MTVIFFVIVVCLGFSSGAGVLGSFFKISPYVETLKIPMPESGRQTAEAI